MGYTSHTLYASVGHLTRRSVPLNSWYNFTSCHVASSWTAGDCNFVVTQTGLRNCWRYYLGQQMWINLLQCGVCVCVCGGGSIKSQETTVCVFMVTACLNNGAVWFGSLTTDTRYYRISPAAIIYQYLSLIYFTTHTMLFSYRDCWCSSKSHGVVSFW